MEVLRSLAAVNGGAGATRRAFRALAIPEVANGIYIGTYLPGSDAATYAGIAGNAAITVGDAFFPSHANVEQGELIRSFYKRVEKAGGIVGYDQIMVSYQFYRALLPENVIEASRVEAKNDELAGYIHPMTPHEGAVVQRSTDVITQE
ncbi:hypothetical protein GLOIN_2v1790588 [Rhizophagus irregularis DAOM 181602=DAOM 197198]|nr:hypothetical protein GLOIN_2v1790588 [Rhizophagus irregularis DAOM 181602=DAOM 197198]